MTNYKHTDAAIEAAKEYGDPRGYYSEGDFLRGVEWAERWIPVEEEMPCMTDRKVIVHIPNDFDSPFVAEYDEGFYINGRDLSESVTHWKHLPNPPHDELQDMVKATNPSYAAFNNNGTIQIRKR